MRDTGRFVFIKIGGIGVFCMVLVFIFFTGLKMIMLHDDTQAFTVSDIASNSESDKNLVIRDELINLFKNKHLTTSDINEFIILNCTSNNDEANKVRSFNYIDRMSVQGDNLLVVYNTSSDKELNKEEQIVYPIGATNAKALANSFDRLHKQDIKRATINSVMVNMLTLIIVMGSAMALGFVFIGLYHNIS